jgi:hypothetical protein
VNRPHGKEELPPAGLEDITGKEKGPRLPVPHETFDFEIPDRIPVPYRESKFIAKTGIADQADLDSRSSDNFRPENPVWSRNAWLTSVNFAEGSSTTAIGVGLEAKIRANFFGTRECIADFFFFGEIPYDAWMIFLPCISIAFSRTSASNSSPLNLQ